MATARAPESALKQTEHRRVGRFVNIIVAAILVATVAVAVRRIIPAERTRPLQMELDLVGRVIAGLDVTAMGDTNTLTLYPADGRVRVLYLYLEECGACDLQKPLWLSLADVLPLNVLIEAIMLSGPVKQTGYFNHRRISEWSAVSPSQLRETIPTTVVPVTLVVATDGSIQFARLGVMGEGQSARLIRRVEQLVDAAAAEAASPGKPSF